MEKLQVKTVTVKYGERDLTAIFDSWFDSYAEAWFDPKAEIMVREDGSDLEISGGQFEILTAIAAAYNVAGERFSFAWNEQGDCWSIAFLKPGNLNAGFQGELSIDFLNTEDNGYIRFHAFEAMFGLEVNIETWPEAEKEKPFDFEGAAVLRKANRHLTPYDTGEALQPLVWGPGTDNAGKDITRYGKVDYDDSEGLTVFEVHAHPSSVLAHTNRIEIQNLSSDAFELVVHETLIATIDGDGKVHLA